LLLAWNKAINLTAIRDPADVARLHVLDSLTAVRPLRERGVDAFLDLGSGGGYPGLPLALALPATDAVLVDSIAKKTSFLGAVLGAISSTAEPDSAIRVVRSRAEKLATAPAERERWPAVASRAVASLADLVEVAFPLLRPGGWLVAWKRGDLTRDLGDELKGAGRAVEALGGGGLDVEDAGVRSLPGHRLVIIGKDRPTDAEWPRNPAERRRRPW
jgi:16S rRNA (guanine527-N7)-methyltransferase